MITTNHMSPGRVFRLHRKPVPRKFKGAIFKIFGARLDDLKPRDQTADISCVRAIVMVALYRFHNLTYENAGRAIGRSHCNVIHFDKAHDARMSSERDYRTSFLALADEMGYNLEEA